MRPIRLMAATGMAIALLVGSVGAAHADADIRTHNESNNTSVKTGDASHSNSYSQFVGHQSSGSATIAEAEAAEAEAAEAPETGATVEGTVVGVVVEGNVSQGNSSSTSTPPLSSADLILADSSNGANGLTFVESLFVGFNPAGLLL